MTLAEQHQQLVALCRQGAFEDAVRLGEQLTELHPQQPALWHMLACASVETGAAEAAKTAFLRTLALVPNDPAVQYNYGCLLQRQHDLKNAVSHFQKATALRPNYKQALNNLGTALRDLGQLDRATSALKQAIEIDPGYVDARLNLASTLTLAKSLIHAIEQCHQILASNPDHQPAIALYLRLCGQVCDFDAGNQYRKTIEKLGRDGAPVPPFTMLSLEDAPERQLERAEIWSQDVSAGIKPDRVPARLRKKLRIAYFSANFCEHPGMYLMAGTFRAHNTDQFEIYAYKTRGHQDDAHTNHARHHSEQFIEVQGNTDAEVAEMARRHELDIGIDLNGHTRNARPGIMAHRVAPVQVSFLGFPGTSGAHFFDYLVADKVVVPPETRPHYSERMIYLPHTYQPTDNQRPIAQVDDRRSDHGLPEDAVVLCCFNSSYKIGRAEFDIWMRVMREFDGAVLWLYQSNAWMIDNLRHAAEGRGVAGERLVFAQRMPHAEHLARHRHADLFLDTFNYNAHTTASDALWAGLPVVTMAGKQFSARVGASLLAAAGLPELIANSPVAYEDLVRTLAQNATHRAELKCKLHQTRSKSALYDTEGYTRSFEAALIQAHALALSGQPPSDIYAPS